MRIFITLFFVVLAAGCQTTNPASDAKESLESDTLVQEIKDDLSFRLWFTFYYKHPQPNMVPEAVAFMSKHGYLKEFPDVSSGFLAQIFAQNPTYLKSWLRGFDSLEPTEWNAILAALYLSGASEARTLIKDNLSRVTPDRQRNFKTMSKRTTGTDSLLGMSILDPRQINVLWAAFSATGDRRYVERVIEHVQWYDTDENSLQSIIAEAAIMTLANNSMQHEIVIETVNQEYKSNPNPQVRVLLQAMLSAIAEVSQEQQKNRPLAH